MGELINGGQQALGVDNSWVILSFSFWLLVLLLFIIPMVMMVYYAAPLVYLNDVQPWAAMKLSFQGCMRNMLPLLWFSLLVTLGFICLSYCNFWNCKIGLSGISAICISPYCSC